MFHLLLKAINQAIELKRIAEDNNILNLSNNAKRRIRKSCQKH